MTVPEVTVGICAYNEAQNIERCIRSVYSQIQDGFRIKEVIVVSSASTDGTDEIVESLQKEYPDLILIKQEKREGKNSAINAYLDAKTCDIVVMVNADNVFGNEKSLSYLLEPFRDEKVGIAGGHPVPTNGKDDPAGFSSHLLWTMHHNLAMIYPKIGELVAFRDIGTRLTLSQQSDEDLIRMYLEKKGYRSVYVPEAIVLNRGPETDEDFLKQRTRVNIGEVVMKEKYGYEIPTWNKKYLAKAAIKTMRDMGFHPLMMMHTASLEHKARSAARRYVREGNTDLSVWDPVKTTKKL